MNCGLTLLELIVALSLSVLLVTTTSGVIKSMTQKKKVFANNIAVQPWVQELAAKLRDDLLRSKEMRIGTKTLELLGFSGHDFATGEKIPSPVFVRWEMKQDDGHKLLIRTEMPRGGIEEMNFDPRSELIALGVTNISIGTFLGLENEEEIELQTMTASESGVHEIGDWTTMPKVLKLIVHGPKQEILIDELVYR